MGRAVVVGHGGFNQESEMILVPPNTSITFLADAGSELGLPFVATGPEGSGFAEGKTPVSTTKRSRTSSTSSSRPRTL